eukprot:3753436-Alexandrium_andersonii.AAC.1
MSAAVPSAWTGGRRPQALQQRERDPPPCPLVLDARRGGLLVAAPQALRRRWLRRLVTASPCRAAR